MLAGRYEIHGLVGGGGMGTVWQGWDRTLDRPTAIKQIRSDIALDPQGADELRHRFEREARVTARLRHPGVPQVYDAVLDTDNDGMYLVMELVEGATLTALLKIGRPPIPWAVSVAAQLAGVLSYAHAIPVVHRDLKPDNLMITPDGTVKVLDFGTAAILTPDTPRLTVTGQMLGTFAYMAPEQQRGGPVSPQTDLYALGCVLHELLTGRPLFSGTEVELTQQHLNAPPVPVRELHPEVPLELESLVLDLLRKHPEARPSEAAEVYERLVPCLPQRGSQAPRAGAAPDVTRVFREPYGPRRQPPPASAREPEPAPKASPELRAELEADLRRADQLSEEGRLSQAGALYASVVRRAAPAYGAESRQVLDVRASLAASRNLAGDHAAAVRELEALVPLFRREFGADQQRTLRLRNSFARSLAVLGRIPEALTELREVYSVLQRRGGNVTTDALEVRAQIAQYLEALGRTTEALQFWDDLVSDLNLTYGPDHPDTQEAKAHADRLRRDPSDT